MYKHLGLSAVFLHLLRAQAFFMLRTSLRFAEQKQVPSGLHAAACRGWYFFCLHICAILILDFNMR